MKPTITLWLALILSLMLAACTSRSDKRDATRQYAFMSKMGLDIGDELTLGDTLALNDIYCGDGAQAANTLPGAALTGSQYAALVQPAGSPIADDMSQWVLLGVRRMGGNVLAAYYAGNGVGYCVSLITYDAGGRLLDAINARELHLLWRTRLGNPSDDDVFTLDAFFTFAGDSAVTLHRTMGLCKMDFDNDLKSAPQWQQQWNQTYIIDGGGHFLLQGQEVVREKGTVDTYAAMDYRTWDLLVCSPRDQGVMDIWEQAVERVEYVYDPHYQYKPFPNDVTQLYRMNPQRFVQWLADHPRCRLQRWFKLAPDDRPALLDEIAKLPDAAARQRLTALVNGWDDKPLTLHG